MLGTNNVTERASIALAHKKKHLSLSIDTLSMFKRVIAFLARLYAAIKRIVFF